MIARLWSALGGDPAQAAEVEIRHPGRYLPAQFDVDGLAVGAVGAMLLAAAEHAEAIGRPRPALALDAEHVAVAFVSERHVRPAPATGLFAALSRFAPTRDGWIRLHANYPHHHAALLRALEATEEDALDAVRQREAEELETAIVDAGGAAAAVRTAAEWSAHPQGQAASRVAIVDSTPGSETRAAPGPHFRVLDLTRVIAGPVATRMLAALGADVLRIDPPHLPELELSIRDGCPGKRLAQLELTKNLNVLDDLLSHADVLIHGYRPGALAAAGLDAARHPHLVVVSLSAWGHEGPWARRRGFDSLVQSACGIAAAQGDGTEPGVLPAQALDHATGYLMAAAALRGMAARRRGEPHADARLALAATAAELMRHPAPDADSQPAESQRWLTALDGQTLVAPPGELDGRPLRWRHGPLASELTWL